MSAPAWLTEKPVAHRGLHNGVDVIENTHSAFQAALDAGYAMECDAQFTQDGEVVVFHDYTLERLTNSSGNVIDMDVAALKEVSFKQSSDKIQTLTELLEQVDGKQPLFIEVKANREVTEQLFEATIRAVEGYNGPFAIMSFDPDIVALCAKRTPHLVRGIVADTADNEHEWGHLPEAVRLEMRHFMHLRHSKPHFVAYGIQDLPQTPPLFAKNHLGLPLLTWTVRTEELFEKAKLYADQVIFENINP